jgi:hypothetical protein
MTWTKGVSGNKSGRPKQGITIPDIIRQKLDERCPDDVKHRLWRDVIAERAIAQAMLNEVAMRNLLDRLYGRATESLELSGKDGGDIVLNFVPVKKTQEPGNG